MEIQSLLYWLRREYEVPVGVWGISLGAWLAGLACCLQAAPAFAVLMIPVVRMQQAVRDLTFCEPLRRAFSGEELPLEALDLTTRRCQLDPADVLLLAGRYDQFVPLPCVEQLWQAWNHPAFWKIPHGHISAMGSPVALERAVRWVQARRNTSG